MVKNQMALVALTGLLTATGCASIFEGKTQAVTFNSEPTGAQVVINGMPMGVTPATITLKKSEFDNANVVFKKDGYQDQQSTLHTKVTGWFWGNIISGGLLGSATDAISGAMWEYSPGNYFVTLASGKASAAELARWHFQNKVRMFILFRHQDLAHDLVRGSGENLTSLFSLLMLKEDQREDALNILRSLSSSRETPPAFAEEVINQFGKS